MESKRIALFQGKEIRKTLHKDEWWFSISDIVETLTDSTDVKQYVKKMRSRDHELDSYWGTNCTPLEMITKDGKTRKIICANTESIFRIIQSIPSPKAEPFKLWLAKVGYERMREIEDPELANKRIRATYKSKGYSDVWIEKRMRGIQVREELTNEWGKRGVQNKEYGILTAEISKATFGMSPVEYRDFKGLQKENLRDHMTDLELIFSMLGEASTTEIAKSKDTQGFVENKSAAKEGGEVAGSARKDLENKTDKKVSTSTNFIHTSENLSRIGSK